MRLVSEYQEDKKEIALITVISVSGNENVDVGEMIAVNSSGERLAGDISSDFIAEEAAKRGQICIQRGLSRKEMVKTDIGAAEIFIHTFCNQDHLILAGAGTVSQMIYRFAIMLGYRITVLDNREDMLARERFPDAYELISGDIVENVKKYPFSENSFLVLATHHHEFDEEILRNMVLANLRYIGVLGNSRRVAEYFHNMEDLQIPEEAFRKVCSPIGLDIGGNQTAEIALSVMAQIQAVKYGKKGGFFPEKQ